MIRKLAGAAAILGLGLLASPAAAAADSDAKFAGVSADGTRFFITTADQLTADDTDSSVDVYQRAFGITTRISVGATNGNGPHAANFAGASADGSRVFFTSSEQLVLGDTDNVTDVYQRQGSTTTLISAGAINGNSPIPASFEAVSANGVRVLFSSTEALAPGDNDGSKDIYERIGSATTHVSAGAINGNGAFPASYAGSSSDGTRVFFTTDEALTSADTDSSDRDVYERSAGATSLLSTGTSNANASTDASFAEASADGTHVLFTISSALEATDTDSRIDIYDRSGGATTQVSVGAINGNGAFDVEYGGMSEDASIVFFETAEQLESGDADANRDVYKRIGGVTAGETTHKDGAFDHNFEGTTADGSRAVITTAEPNCGTSDVDAEIDVFTYDVPGTSHACNSSNGNGPFPVKFEAIAASGFTPLYTTQEAISIEDGDESTDVYNSGTVASQGAINGNGGFPAKFAGVSPNGTQVFFTSFERLDPRDVDDRSDVYIHNGGVTSLISIEAIPPETTITGGVPDGGFTKNDTPGFEFSSSEAGSSFSCRIDLEPFAPCASPKLVGPLGDGAHTFEVQATDAAGNADPTVASRTFTVDTIDPDPQIDTGPPALTRNPTPSFGFSADEPVTFACRVDADPYAPCSGAGTHTTGTLADGAHRFALRARDQAGNTEYVTRSFTVDTTPPQTTIGSVVVTGTRARVTFSGSDASTPLSFQCKLDGGSFSACNSGKVFRDLAPGSHTIRVRAKDAAGNRDPTPASKKFSV